MTESRPPTIVCLATHFKGIQFMRECKQQGWRVILVTKERWRDEDWPRESLDDLVTVPDGAGPELFIDTVAQLARPQKVECVTALEEFDVITAGLIREHLRLPGMVSSTARLFRDKLAMRTEARRAGVNVPDFVHVLNYEELGEYMNRVPPPWVLKPRSDVSAFGIKKIEESEQVWRAIDALDGRERLPERSSYYLLERYIPGDVYHVDSLVVEGQVVFAGINRYGRPPMDVTHGGGVFLSHTVEYDTADRRSLFEINYQVLAALGLRQGAAHAEFIKGGRDGKFYFVEVAARVGGAYIAEMLEAASGVNIWREWAKIELARDERPYRVPSPRKEYSGIALSLARQEYPDTSDYTDPEIVYRVRKPYHVGLIVRSPELKRVLELLDQYARRFADDFCAVVPPPERAE